MHTPEMPLRRDVATLVFVDVVESVCVIASEEWAGVQRIRRFLDRAERDAVIPLQGRVIERRGDGLLLLFTHPRAAVRCASLLHTLAGQAGDDGLTLSLRAGVHKTEYVTDGQALYGLGVSLAARIAAVGQPGDTLLSAEARDELNAELDGQLQDLGANYLKHVEAPLRLFRYREGQLPLPAGLERAIAHRMKLRPTLVVLPLLPMPDGAGANAPALSPSLPLGLGDVAADQMTREFSRSPVLHVISALSAQALRGRVLDFTQLYQQLRADYIFEGHLLGAAEPAGGHPPANQRVSVQASLWRRGTGEPVWTDTVHGTALDLLSPHSEPLGRLVQAVSQRILAVEQRAVAAGPVLPTLASHTLYLNAVDLLHRFGQAEFQRAHDLLLSLSERAPRHPEPLAWLARWHVFRVVQGWSDNSQRDGEQALQYSERALDRDPHSALALTMAGSVHAGVKRDAVAAQRFYAQALQHNPNDSLAWLMSGVALGFMDHGAPALAASETALGLAPVDPTRHYYDALAASAALNAGEYERCMALAARSIQANGTHGSAYRAKAIAEGLLGRTAEACDTVKALLGVEPHFTLRHYLARLPEQDTHRELYASVLKAAGLPED